jgi:hypothetical protein
MNRTAIHSFSIALCVSLALHAAIVWTFVRAMINNPIWLAGWDRAARVEDADDARPVFVDPQTRLPDTMLGAMDGKAHAIDPSDGETPLEARKGDQDQQFLSRDPEGPGKIGAEPSPSVLPPSEDATPAIASAAPFGVESKQLEVPKQIARETDERRGQFTDHVEQTSPPTPPSAQAPPPAPPVKASSNLPPADPAPMAQSETDPYSVAGSVRFKPGKADVQFGRKHKLVRPRFDLSAQASLLKLPSPIIIALKLDLDAQGNVTHVEITHHSGSDDIDQAITIAAYKWWLEPSKDKAGNPVADTVPFVIRLD